RDAAGRGAGGRGVGSAGQHPGRYPVRPAGPPYPVGRGTRRRVREGRPMALVEPQATEPQPAQQGPARQERAGSAAWRRFARNRLAVAGALVTLLLLAAAVFADVVAPYDPLEPDYSAALQPPGPGHPLGTDDLGRDVLSRVIHGARASFQ